MVGQEHPCSAAQGLKGMTSIVMTSRLSYIFCCILFLWPCLSSLTGKAIEDAGEETLWTETRASICLSLKVDESGNQYLLAERLKNASEVRGLKGIRLKVEGPLGGSSPLVFGKSSGDENRRIFHPAFPLQSGLNYMAVVSVGYPSEAIPFILSIPKEEKVQEASVSAVYPSADQLPENLLKFYIHFSHPMSVGNVYDFIHLLDEQGKEVELPFLELGEELWDYDSQRLTLLFDPGRIKSGLVPNLQEGLALHAGHSYTLKIDAAWQDAHGQPLVEGFEKTFAVTAGDTISPNPYNWKKSWPKADTKEPIVLIFPESLDRALLQRLIVVQNRFSQVMNGSVTVGNQETRWTFTPDVNWLAGKYRLEIETILEDVAGNSIARPFELVKTESENYRAGPEVVHLDFEIK